MNRNGAWKIADPIRLSPHQAARQIGVRSKHIKDGLTRHQFSPGNDGTFSLREIFQALNDLGALEAEAKRASFQAKIDDAAFRKLRLEEKRNELVPVLVAADQIQDLAATWFTAIRHSSMPKSEQRQLIDQCVEIAERKFPANGTPESKAAIRRQESQIKSREYDNGQASIPPSKKETIHSARNPL